MDFFHFVSLFPGLGVWSPEAITAVTEKPRQTLKKPNKSPISEILKLLLRFPMAEGWD